MGGLGRKLFLAQTFFSAQNFLSVTFARTSFHALTLEYLSVSAQQRRESSLQNSLWNPFSKRPDNGNIFAHRT